ncbi:hypothetical protein HIM_00827 [Hirsutella minnesotensis 3608]|nr:hypothetical protein HIM_00827 [Hirsutella minnesotensis 3608]
MDETISDFVSITGATADVAQGFLQLAGGNFENAVGLFFENPDLVSGVGAGVAGNADSESRPAASSAGRPNIGRQDSSGVIHISDDEDDFMNVDDDGHDSDGAVAAQAAALAQEEEDAAMAKRLQEELYQGGQGSGAGDAEDVRAPIARTTETLVAPDPSWAGDDDVGSAFLEQMRRRRPPPPRSGGPFGQRIWADGDAAPAASSENGAHARRLEDLFRPPYDLMSRVSWDEARTLGKEDKKWLLVNLQDMNDFNCQALNRDVWKDEAVRAIVSENFIFLQYDKDYPDAEEYITFYFPHQSHENPDNYPHVSIVDPRTGEQVKVWSGRPFPSAVDFHAELAEFLDRYSLAANSKNPVAKSAARKPAVVDVDRMTEEEMLEMALKNSLAGGESSASGPSRSAHDPDALTKSPGPSGDDAVEDRGKEPETAGPVAASAFSQISDSKPHAEPDHDAATTTRIQFRHATGRVIRRFRLQDPVRRIYEWLKAEPLEGKQGVAFELKRMPQGQDLIDSLEQTIEETSLKQGTVMVEFVEE